MNLPAPDQILASAVRFLVEGGESDAANVLLSCSLDFEEVTHTPQGSYETSVCLRSPRSIFDLFDHYRLWRRVQPCRYSDYLYEHDFEFDKECFEKIQICCAIENAIRAVFPDKCDITNFGFRAELTEIDKGWRDELIAIVRGVSVHNQAAFGDRIVTWMNLRFRSQTEVRIAQALDGRQVIYFPNCMARLGFKKRENREPDFLIGHKGKWGILEVDGGPYHPPSRTVEDHERDRLFKAHGIKVVEHFDAGECFENAKGVVDKFLFLLGNA